MGERHMSMSIYKMPNGRRYKFEDGTAPAEAVKVVKKAKAKPKAEPKPETKEKAKKPVNKAKKTTNKTKKVENK